MDENLKKQAELMSVIDRETAAYKHAFGYTEWRSACEVGCLAPWPSGPSKLHELRDAGMPLARMLRAICPFLYVGSA